MKITFAELAGLEQPASAVIHSLDQALYQITVNIGDESRLLAENDGKIFRCHSLQRARDALVAMPVQSIVLRQQSAYDEIVGQPLRQEDNTLEIPLAPLHDEPPTIH